MKKKLSIVIGALVAAQLLSGCYFLRELDWKKDIVPRGESTKATINLQPSGEEETSYFFMGMAGKGTGFTVKRPVFDVQDVTGQEQKLIEDNSLGEFIENDCGVVIPTGSVRGPGIPSVLWRTENEVDGGRENRFVDVRLKAKRASNDGGGFAGVVITGRWIDDGDGVPEDPDTTDDSISCTGQSTTSFLMKGDAP